MRGEELACAVCGRPNECEVAAGRGNCWCFAADVSGEVTDALAERGIDDSCICPECAAGRVPSPCQRSCQLTPNGAACGDCGRSIPEIMAWSSMSAGDKARVWLRLRQVRAAR